MPPRNAPIRGGPRRGRASTISLGGRGGGAGRGSQLSGIPAAHVEAVGLKRPDFGKGGRVVQMQVNSFAVRSFPQEIIFHYDVVEPDKLPARFNFELFKKLQSDEPEVFERKIVYDGRKIAFSSRELPLGPNNSRRFSVTLPQANGGGNPTRPPRVYYITLTMVAQINPEVLDRYIHGEQSTDEKVLTALTALNVVIRMEPNSNFPFNKRSFYTPQDRKAIKGGMEVWRGIFQSVRPTIGRLVVNVDLTNAVMYKEGHLINLCLEFMNKPLDTNPAQILSPVNTVNNARLSERDRLRLQRFLVGLRVQVSTTGTKPRVIRGLSRVGANAHTFDIQGGGTMSVAQYFASIGHPLRFPTVICVQVGATAMIPLEKCTVPRGQIVRKQIPEEQMKEVLTFATLKPNERLGKIKAGIQDLQYGQSNYVNDFGMQIDSEPLKVDARILNPPKLRYNKVENKQTMPAIIDPRMGAWNMVDKRFYQPAKIVHWVVVVYADRFSDALLQDAITGFLDACRKVGVIVEHRDPLIRHESGQGNIGAQLRSIGGELLKTRKSIPSLFVVILPEGGGDIYTKVKHFGDVANGVATQCLRANKCGRATEQYWMNVLLKVNVKLGGINVIPDPSVSSTAALIDPVNPTVVLGADVIHPPPHTTDRPSFTAVVGSVDTHAAKYVATSRVQTGRQEIIDDMKEMCKHVLKLYMRYREVIEKKGEKDLAPKRLIFYRDGVSEGQFKHVLELELPLIRQACEELKIKPKITLIIVGKRHHNQMFPLNNTADKSGNAPAGSVIDTGIAHPTDFDFFLQSHAGILGTSRPGHYTVLHDDYGFNADSIQAISFALCHVYARATRSVSIPAPVYYADIVCSRAKNHFDPNSNLDLSDTSTQASGGGGSGLQAYKDGYKRIHSNQEILMYFSVCLLDMEL